MATTQTRLRAQSLTNEDEPFGRPRPAQTDTEAPQTDGPHRAAMPRAVSEMNMRSVANMASQDAMSDDPERAFRDIAREQVDRETLRALAQFFRSTGPPTGSHPPVMENCFGVPGAAGDMSNNKRWSIRSLKKGNNNRGRIRPTSLQLGEHTVLRTTSAGHTYMAISIPAAYAAREKRTNLTPRLRHAQTSSQGGNSTISGRQTSHSQATVEEKDGDEVSNLKEGDLGVVVSRGASWHDRNSFTLSIKVSTAERGVRSFLSLVDEWLEEQNTSKDLRTSPKRLRITSPDDDANDLDEDVSSSHGPGVIIEEEQDEEAPPTSKNPQDAKSTPAIGETPITPPPFTQETSFLDLGPDRSSMIESGPQDQAAISPKTTSPSLSAFPYVNKGSPGSAKSAKSPRSQKKPAKLQLKSRLQVPESSAVPESPGFPSMLASMTFPAPPESLRSHSASNSVSSAAVSPTVPARKSSATPPPSSLDSRVLQLSKPPLRHHKSDGIVQSAARKSTASSVASSRGSGLADSSSTRASRPYHRDTAAVSSRQGSTRSQNKNRSMSRLSMDSSGVEDVDSSRQSTSSTVESSTQFTALSDANRYSLRSDTSAASDVTATTEAFGKERPTNRDSGDSTTLGTESRIGHRRSETPCSVRSASSNGTTATATSLRERRMARRARVREKVQRDIDASKSSQVTPPRTIPGAQEDALDSPVLGRFPQSATGGASRKTAAQGPSPLAQQLSSPATPVTPTTPADLQEATVKRRPSTHDISQLIPETVEETASPVSPTAPRPGKCTLTPIAVVSTRPDEPEAPTLSITPIMVVANIEARAPPKTLRPLSLLNGGSSPPHLASRSSLRSDGKMSSWQRPFPVRVSKNPLELTVNTNTKSKRNSSPHIPTPPMSPETTTSPNVGRPLSALPASSARSSSNESGVLSPLSSVPHSAPQASSSTDKETQWLSAHQRQTAQEWRLAALRERMRRERVDEEAPKESSSLERASTLSGISSSEESEGRAETGYETEKQMEKRQRHHSSTLKALSANAPAQGHHGVSGGKYRPSFTDLRGSFIPEGNGEITEQDIEQRLLGTIVPLLENMNSTLRELQRDSVSREMSLKFMDSALAIANPILERTKRPQQPQSQAQDSRAPQILTASAATRVRAESVVVPPAVTARLNAAQKHTARSQSIS